MKTGEKAPGFELFNTQKKEVSLSHFAEEDDFALLSLCLLWNLHNGIMQYS